MTNLEIVYWEKQGKDRLCAVHCVNSLLQGPKFSEFDFSRIGQALDKAEAALGIKAAGENMDASGYFSIGVIEGALLEAGKLNCVNLNKPEIRTQVFGNLNLEQGFICNCRDHWFTLRRVGTQWWNLDSLKPAPRRVTDAELRTALVDAVRDGYSIFAVRGPGLLPSPERPRKPLHSHQFVLTSAEIARLEDEANKKEAADINAAQEGGFQVAGRQVPKKTDFSKLSGGQTLSGAAVTPPDAETKAALAESAREFSEKRAKSLPPEPENIPADRLCAFVLKGAGGARRRFDLQSTTLEHLFTWIEAAAVPSPLLSEVYSIVRSNRQRIKRLPREELCFVGEIDSGKLTLEEAGFESGQEALQII